MKGCDIIKTYQMRDYPCLYYFSQADQLTREDQCLFLCGLSSIFHLKKQDIAACSVLFAHTSNGILYDGIGFSDDEVENLGLSKLKNSFTDCTTLSKWDLVKKSNFKKNCCIVCPLSTTYLNARIDSERLCLRYVISTGKLASLEHDRYLSVVPIAAGNDLSQYPTIPLYDYLNKYFIKNDPHEPYIMDELISSFGKYLCKELSYTDNKHIDALLSCVKREITQLYKYDFSSINKSEVTICHFNLLSTYTYEAPRMVNSDDLVNIPTIKPVKRVNHRSEKNIDLKQESVLEVNSTINKTTSNTKATNVDNNIPGYEINNSCQTTETYIPIPSIQEETKIENNVSIEKDNIPSDIINDVSESFSEDNSVDITNNDTIYINCIPNVYNISINDDNVPLIENIDSLTYPNYSIPTGFSKIVVNCLTDDASSILQFIKDTCSSRFLCMESVIYNNRHGLLCMTTNSNKYYFYDIGYNSPGYLYPVLSDATKLRILSLNSIPVISMLSKLGFNTLNVDSLSGLYCTLNNLESIYDYNEIFEEELSIKKGVYTDFYQYYMPYYEQLYNVLQNKLNSNTDKNLMSLYNRGIDLNEVLGCNFDLSDILYQADISISGQGYFNYNFLYSKDSTLIKAGIMYIVTISSFVDENDINNRIFLENICIGIQKSPYKCITYAKLLNVLNNTLIYYSIQDGDLFFDILLDKIRRNYKKQYNEIPLLKTYRIEYK